MWLLFAQAFTVLGLLGIALYLLPLPIFDRNSVTVMCASALKKVATARALSTAIGKPIAELNTSAAERYFFKDGAIVDWLPQAPNSDICQISQQL